jgi:hypothetical protein
MSKPTTLPTLRQLAAKPVNRAQRVLLERASSNWNRLATDWRDDPPSLLTVRRILWVELQGKNRPAMLRRIVTRLLQTYRKELTDA